VNTSKPKIDTEKGDCWQTTENDDMMETNVGETLMTEGNGNGKIDALIDQVGRMTEGITDLKGVVDRVVQTVDRVAQSVERVAQSVEQVSQKVDGVSERLDKVVQSSERQERNIDRLTIVSEQQSETTQRLVKIVEGLLEKK
jgi:methyl-accepting chemotaxis protein